jgi:hypothetical protein
MKHALAAIALLLVACHRENASGLTQEQAEAKLLDQGYTYPTIGPSPEGYTRQDQSDHRQVWRRHARARRISIQPH